jgi:hypothetical protein
VAARPSAGSSRRSRAVAALDRNMPSTA